MMRKKLTIGIVLVGMMGHSLIADAAELNRADTEDENGDLSVLECAQKGGRDFAAFLDVVIWNEGFDEAIKQPWSDILYRNQCHSNDVIGLVRGQDKIRSRLREAFLTCENQSIPELKVAHHRLTAEIYYVRHVVDGELVLSLPMEIYNSRDYSNAFFADRDLLYQEMKERFVRDGWFTLGEFDDLYIGLELKYQDRKNSYIQCEAGSWQQVADRWNEFTNHFTEDYGGLKQAGQGIAGQAQSLAKEAGSIATVDLFQNDKSLREWAGTFVEAQVNGLEPAKGLEEIFEEIKAKSPTANAPTPSQRDFLNAVSFEDRGFEISKIEAEMRADFITQYAAGSESVEIFVNELDGRSSEDVEGLYEILDTSFPELNKILKGAKMMVDRQCPA